MSFGQLGQLADRMNLRLRQGVQETRNQTATPGLEIDRKKACRGVAPSYIACSVSGGPDSGDSGKFN
jgi:hypothetical protein